MSNPPTPAAPESMSFAFEAQTVEGQAIRGAIDAADADQAARKLQALRLRVLQLAQSVKQHRASIGSADFLAFNEQLANLTRAGMPIEHGLRLIGQDMRTRALRSTVNDVAESLERGVPLAEAFEQHRSKFPPLYGRIVDAGVTSGNLSAVLLNLGRHLELITRLRSALWRAAAYPLAVIVGLLIVALFLSKFVIPQFSGIFRDFGIRLPIITTWILSFPLWVPKVVVAILAILIIPMLVWPILRRQGVDQAIAERLLHPLPLIGPILKTSAIARWCDAMAIGVNAGLDLPASVGLAADATNSPRLRKDGQAILGALERGEQLDRAARDVKLVPVVILTGIELTSKGGELAETLRSFGQMYRQQAEVRISLLPAVLMPTLLIIVAGFIALVILAIFAPLISLLQAISG